MIYFRVEPCFGFIIAQAYPASVKKPKSHCMLSCGRRSHITTDVAEGFGNNSSMNKFRLLIHTQLPPS